METERTNPLLTCNTCCRTFSANAGLPPTEEAFIPCPHCGAHYVPLQCPVIPEPSED
jgi:hypothetical protein